MKKTLKFDDGSILVGSSSTFTVTQEDQGKIDIFDMPSKYIWISNRDVLDDAKDYDGDLYIGIFIDIGSKRYILTVQDLQPSKYENIKCKVIERTETEDASAVVTLLDGTKKYNFGDISYWNEEEIVKIDSIKPVQDRVIIEELPNLTEVNLKGNINVINIINNPKLTKITCDQAIHPTTIKINNNPLLTSVPEFEPGVYNNMKEAFMDCLKLNIDTSVFQLSGDCRSAFRNTNIHNLVINDAGITNIEAIAMGSTFSINQPLKTVTINGTLQKCTNFHLAFSGNKELTTCDMSGVNFASATDISYMFSFDTNLTTVNINYETFRLTLENVESMFLGSGITDDIIFQRKTQMDKFYQLCSSYTKRLDFVRDETIRMHDPNYGIALNNATSLEYLKWDNIGNKENQTAFNFTANTKLGTGSDENLQAFKNLFINAFDRKTAGYSVCTVRLADTQKALLTSEEITAFENKGYKIA